jgi:DNA-binding PadR family transcriptional regulator
MSTELRLSTTSYVVLGLIGLRGPSTPYDLKRAVAHSIGFFWPFPHTQLYDEPARLAEHGLLTVSHEPDGRRRKLYAITEAGLRELRAWLKAPTDEQLQLRNAAEIKLFFCELGDAEDVQALAREQVTMHEQRIAELDAIAERFHGRDDLAARLVPLELGRRIEQTALKFWREQLR